MTSGFGHFDGGHRENFCAAVLLLAMDLDPVLRSLVAKVVLRTLGGAGAERLVSAGREARLEETELDNYAPVHGLAVPFSALGQKGRLGIYKYEEAPPDEAGALDSVWLEAYFGEADQPAISLPFAPSTLAPGNLDEVRAQLAQHWAARFEIPNVAPTPNTAPTGT